MTKEFAMTLYFIGCALFMLAGLISCGIIRTEIIFQWIRGGRYELWWVDFPVCDSVWHYTTTPNQRPNCICRGSVIKVREYKGFWIFKRKYHVQ